MPGSPTRDIVVSGVHFADETDVVPKPFRCSLFDLLGDEHEPRAEKRGTGGYSPVDYVPGATRGREGVARVNLIGLDFDHLSQVESERLATTLAGYAFVRHSTFSHQNGGPDDNCFRVLMPVTRSMTPDESVLVRAEILRELGVAADENASDPSRLWYFPACPPSCLSRAFIEYTDGDPIPVDTVLALARAHQEAARPPTGSALTTPGLRRRLERLRNPEHRELLRAVLAGEPFASTGARNATAWRIVSTIAFAAPDATAEAIVELLRPSIAAMATQEPSGALTIDGVEEMAARALTEARGAGGVLRRGDEVELAQVLLDELKPDGDVVHDRGGFFQYRSATGIWEPVPREALSRRVQGFAGRPVLGGDASRQLRVGSRAVAGTIALAADRVAQPSFFTQARPGVAFSNGFIEVSATGIHVHPHGPENRATFRFEFPYDPAARMERFDEFLHQVFQGDEDGDVKRALVREFSGAALCGFATHLARALALLGAGRNGKSTLLRVIEALFPASVREAIPPQFFDGEYYRAKLEGVRLNSVSELPKGEILRAESLKAVFAGDPIVGRAIRGEPRTFTPRAGHIFAANGLPSTDDLSPAFWARFLIVKFNRTFDESEQEKGLADRIVAEELPGVAAWALEGARRLLQRSPMRYPEPASHLRELAEWRTRADQVMQFVEEVCMRTSVAAERTPGSVLFATYRRWAEENGHGKMNNGNFAERLRNLGIRSVKPGSQRLYELKLRNAPPPSPFRRGPTGSPTADPPDAPPDARSTNLPN